jgi:hypothetical protein
MAETIEEILRKRLASIKLLPPEKRMAAIKQLEAEIKRIEEQRKREIEQAVESAEDMGHKAIDEIEELKKFVPESKAIKIEDLFAKQAEELEKKVEDAEALAAGAGGSFYSKNFDEMKTDFYKLVENSQPRLSELREKAAKGELNPAERASFENYFHTFENFSQVSNYVSEGTRERFLSEERTLGSIAKYIGHQGPSEEENARRRRRAM